MEARCQRPDLCGVVLPVGPGVGDHNMIWILLIVLLILVFGLGSVLEAAFWTLLIIAAAVVILALAIARALGR